MNGRAISIQQLCRAMSRGKRAQRIGPALFHQIISGIFGINCFPRTDRGATLVRDHRIDLRRGQPIPPHSVSMIRRPEILAQVQIELAPQFNISLGE
jgi:hypothetical protein